MGRGGAKSQFVKADNLYNFMDGKHYVCDGNCGGVSDVPGVCQTPSCPRYDQPLRECECEDGKHGREGGNPPPENL